MLRSFILFAWIIFILFGCDNEVTKNTEVYDSVEFDEAATIDLNDEKLHARTGDETTFYEETMPWIESFINAALNDDLETLSHRINYPLRRQDPIPAIMNEQEFMDYSFKIFDDNLKDKLSAFLDAPDILDFRGSNGTIGILNGTIWFWEDGSVSAINYTSNEELEYQNSLTEELVNQLHPSIKDFEQLYYLGKTSKFIIRIDDTERGLRYASWSSKNKMSQEPDLILYDGILEKQGTAGGYTYTFKNDNYAYILNQIFTAERDVQLGDFLIVKENDVIISEEACTEIFDSFELL